MPNTKLLRLLGNRVYSAGALAVGILLVSLTLGTVVMLGWFEYQDTLREDRANGELQARVLEDHATRSFETVSVVLTYLSYEQARHDIVDTSAGAYTLLTQALIGLPCVREICTHP